MSKVEEGGFRGNGMEEGGRIFLSTTCLAVFLSRGSTRIWMESN